MARKGKSEETPESGRDEYVPAVFARSPEEAENYQQLLSDHDIPAVVADDENLDELPINEKTYRRKGMTRGVPVLVPESLLDEASEVIADREELDEFEANDEFEDEEDDDFDFEEGFEEEEPDDDLFDDEDEEDVFFDDDEDDEDIDDEDDDEF